MDRAESGFRRRRNRRGRGRPLYKTLKCRAGEGNLPEKIPANYSHLFTALLLQLLLIIQCNIFGASN
jgi:hypothetical protein